MNTLLIIDYNSLFRRVMELQHITLSWNGVPTNGVYGFITQFCESVSAVNPERVIVCSDYRPYERSELFPDYKKKHKTEGLSPKVIKFNRSKVDEFINLLNIPYWKVKGLEADDLIAICCRDYHRTFDRIVVASSDSDLFQLLRYKNVFLRRKVNKKYVLYSRESFKKEFDNMSIKQFIRYLCIKGTHNAIPGIKGLGEVGAMKIARDDDMWKALLKEHHDELVLYRILIKLPFRYDLLSPRVVDKLIYPERKIIVSLSASGINMTKSMEKALSLFRR
jgi:DNA polymerase-1